MNACVRSAIAMSDGCGQGGPAGASTAVARASVKVPGGKLVTAVVRLASDAHVRDGVARGNAVAVPRIADVRFSGDFFMEKAVDDDAREAVARSSRDMMTDIRSKSVHDLAFSADDGAGAGIDGAGAGTTADALAGDEIGINALDAMGHAVAGIPADAAMGAIARLIGDAIPEGVRLEGASPADFAAAVVKAVRAAGGAHDDGDDAAAVAAAELGSHTPAVDDERCAHDAPQAVSSSASLLLARASREKHRDDGRDEGAFGSLPLAQDDEGRPDSARDDVAWAGWKRLAPVRDSAAPTAWPDERWRELPLEVVVPEAIGCGAANAKGPGDAWSATGDGNAGSPTPSDNGTNHRGAAACGRSGVHPSANGSASAGGPGAYDPAMQMALDEVIARAVAAGECGPMLRFWEWSAPAVVIGAFQSLHDEVDLAAAQARGMTVVRRMTGGGAMFIEPGNTITYSLYVPASFAEGLTVTQSYRLCDAWLLAALARLGVDAYPGGMNDIVSPAGKIAGAAQRRFAAPARRDRDGTHLDAAASSSDPARPFGHQSEGIISNTDSPMDANAGMSAARELPPSAVIRDGAPGAILHHVTMAYDIDAQAMARVLRINKEKTADKAVKSAIKRVDPLRSQTGLTRAAIVAGLAGTLLERLPRAHAAALSPRIIERARTLAATKYADPSWTALIP